MTDENKGVENEADETAKGTPPEKKEPADEGKKDDGTVPRHRLNEAETKRKEAEAEVQKAKANEAAAVAKIEALTRTLSGATKNEREEKIAAFAKRHNLDESFIGELVALNQPENKPDPSSQKAIAEVRFAEELDALIDAIPEAEEMSREERKSLKDRAFSKEFHSTPLKTIYRDMMYDKRTESKKTFEESRAGGGKKADDANPDFSTFTPDQMREWDAKNLNRRRHR